MLKIESFDGFNEDDMLNLLRSIDNEIDDGEPYYLDDDDNLVYLGVIFTTVTSSGGEGEGEYAYQIIKLKYPDGTVEHLKHEYSYYSHYGYSYDNASYTKIVKKMVTEEKWVEE
jgi:hypothetical protein